MKQRFRLFQRRGGVFYSVDNVTGKQTSLRTEDPREAQRLLNAKNEAERQPAINLQIARAYLLASDTGIATRTWHDVMEEVAQTKNCSKAIHRAYSRKAAVKLPPLEEYENKILAFPAQKAAGE